MTSLGECTYLRVGMCPMISQLPRSVPESPGMPVTGSPSMLKGYQNSLIDGSPSILVSPNTPPLRRALHDRVNE